MVSLHPGECYSVAGVTTSQVCASLATRNDQDLGGNTQICILTASTGSPLIRMLYCVKSKAGQFGQGGNPLALELEFSSTWLGTVNTWLRIV